MKTKLLLAACICLMACKKEEPKQPEIEYEDISYVFKLNRPCNMSMECNAAPQPLTQTISGKDYFRYDTKVEKGKIPWMKTCTISASDTVMIHQSIIKNNDTLVKYSSKQSCITITAP